MSCPDVDLFIQAWDEGRVPEELEAHMEVCPACRKMWRILKNAPAFLQPEKPVPDYLTEAALAGIEAGCRRPCHASFAGGFSSASLNPMAGGLGERWVLGVSPVDSAGQTTNRRDRRRPPMTFTIELDQEPDGRWLGEISALPGELAYGVTATDAIARVQTPALRVLADRLEPGEAVPEFLSVSFRAA